MNPRLRSVPSQVEKGPCRREKCADVHTNRRACRRVEPLWWMSAGRPRIPSYNAPCRPDPQPQWALPWQRQLLPELRETSPPAARRLPACVHVQVAICADPSCPFVRHDAGFPARGQADRIVRFYGFLFLAARLKTVAVILNPASGSGAGRRQRSHIERGLSERGISHRVLETSKSGDALSFAHDLARGGTTHIIAAGGDGTIHEV